MGGRTGASVAQRLIAEGLAEETPCVVTTSISRHEEKQTFGTLGELACGTLMTESDEPVLIGIGVFFAAAASLSAEGWPMVACQ